MIDYIRQSLLGQFESALAMHHECISLCPAVQWDQPIANYPFWVVAYHTLCYADLFMTPGGEKAFSPRPIHPKGWYEYEAEFPSRRFEQAELVEYAIVCRDKARTVLPSETEASLSGPSGFARQPFSRLELHLYNLRHIMHHTGQLSAFLRKANVDTRWVKTGWPA